MEAVLYFHRRGQFLATDSDQKIAIPAGKLLFLDIRHEIFESYQKPKKENDHGSFNVTCIQHPLYSYDQCVKDVSSQTLINETIFRNV